MHRLVPHLLALATISILTVPGEAAARSQASASSTFKDADGVTYSADLAFDGLFATGWAEGDAGYGDGAWLELDLRKATEVKSLSIWPGNLSEGKKSYREYSRPKVISVFVDGQRQGEPIRLLDEMQRLDVPVAATGRKIRISIDEAYEGFVYQDCFIAEVGVNYLERHGEIPDGLGAWMDSAGGQISHEAHLADVKKHYRAHKDAEFGDSQAMKWIMDAAGDGAPYLRAHVLKHVDIGSRVAAITPDTAAVDALRKLKDPNGIPAIELAALRAIGEDEAFYAELVEIFYAHQQFIGGPNPNIPYWGAEGWGLGALRSFGEPLPVAMDRFGLVYVADIGNNRIQRFEEDGRPDRTWGGAPGISDVWFAGSRPWYVSGATPGDEPGEFFSPLDVVIIPAKESDGFAALDGRGRVQVFDAEGKQVIGWHIQTSKEILPGLGGQAYLAWIPKKELLYVFWGSEAIGYNLLGEEVARFDIADGTPNAVAVEKSGKLLLAYRNEIVRYDLDGFRYQVALDMNDYAAGFEDVDLAFDDKWRLWVLLDTGWAYKFRRPKKLDYRVKVADYSLERPRMAVREDLLHISDRNRILKVDALQLRIKAEDEAARAMEEADDL